MPLPRRAAGAFISIPHWPLLLLWRTFGTPFSRLDVLLNIKHRDGHLLWFKTCKVDSAAAAAILLQRPVAQRF